MTGVLPVALGRATRIVQALLTAGKEYVAIMHLHKEIEEERLRETINKYFIGKIEQMPPLKSSVKRQLRTRTVYYFDILEIDGKDVLFKVGTEAGTYIRKLCFDIGKKLGAGAHMAELRRTKAGPFDESALFTLQELTDAYYFWKPTKIEDFRVDEREHARSRMQLTENAKHFLVEGNEKFIRKVIQPAEAGIKHLPKIWVFDTTVESLCHGIDLKVPGISKLNDNINEDETVAIMTLKDELVALGTAKMTSKEMLGEKGVAVQIEKVFMLPGVYKINK